MTSRAKRSIATLAVVAVAGATVLAAPAVADKGKKRKKKRIERTEERDYVGWSGVRGAVEGECNGEPVGCVVFPIETGERFVSLDIADSAGEPVWASVYIYGYNSPSDPHEHVCGGSEDPLRLLDGVQELVVVLTQTSGGATSPCTGAATTGTVSATFSNRP